MFRTEFYGLVGLGEWGFLFAKKKNFFIKMFLKANTCYLFQLLVKYNELKTVVEIVLEL